MKQQRCPLGPGMLSDEGHARENLLQRYSDQKLVPSTSLFLFLEPIAVLPTRSGRIGKISFRIAGIPVIDFIHLKRDNHKRSNHNHRIRYEINPDCDAENRVGFKRV